MIVFEDPPPMREPGDEWWGWWGAPPPTLRVGAGKLHYQRVVTVDPDDRISFLRHVGATGSLERALPRL